MNKEFYLWIIEKHRSFFEKELRGVFVRGIAKRMAQELAIDLDRESLEARIQSNILFFCNHQQLIEKSEPKEIAEIFKSDPYTSHCLKDLLNQYNSELSNSNKMNKEFYLWLIKERRDDFRNWFRPKLIDAISEQIAMELMKDLATLKRDVMYGDRYGGVYGWEDVELIEELTPDDITSILRSDSGTETIVNSLFDQYNLRTKVLEERCKQALEDKICPVCRGLGYFYTVIKPFSIDKKDIDGNAKRCPLCDLSAYQD